VRVPLLVALPKSKDLFINAKHLFVAAMDGKGPNPAGERCRAGAERGLRGLAGRDAFTWVGVKVDRASYSLVAVMSDGSEGPTIPLRGLFEQYDGEHMCAVETIVERCAAEAAKMAKWRW
jgi:hypothetical protein